MSNGISNSDLIDLQRTTLENLPDMEFEVALRYQEYNVVNQWFTKEKMDVESGTSIKRNILLENSGNARHVRLFQKITLNVGDVQSQITAPWVQVNANYSIERREALRNRKPAMYIKLLTSRRMDSMLALADLLETRAWLTPETSADDLNPRGLPYWLSKVIPTNGTGYSLALDGANGQTVGGGFVGRRIRYNGGTDVLTDKGGIDPTAQARWRNWADVYQAIDADFVRRMRRAFHATSFKSPMLAKDMREGPQSKYRIYMGLNTLTDYEDLATKQNENNGPDLDPFHGVTTFRRVPILYTPQLDSDADSVVYAVNHAKFFPIVQEGDWMRESEPMMDVEQPDTMTTHVSGSYQYFAKNVREGGFVLSKMPST